MLFLTYLHLHWSCGLEKKRVFFFLKKGVNNQHKLNLRVKHFFVCLLCNLVYFFVQDWKNKTKTKIRLSTVCCTCLCWVLRLTTVEGLVEVVAGRKFPFFGNWARSASLPRSRYPHTCCWCIRLCSKNKIQGDAGEFLWHWFVIPQTGLQSVSLESLRAPV